MRLFLIGLRGTGKTTVGRLLAERLLLPFSDMDVELESRHGRSIREIFASGGEAEFRRLEEQLLAELSQRGPAVIATGGGVVLSAANRERMKSSGKVIWLTAECDSLWRRIEQDRTTAVRRPDLAGGGRLELQQTLQAREPLYRACADVAISTQDRSPDQIAADIVALCLSSSWTMAR
jgi:shikimate kinase